MKNRGVLYNYFKSIDAYAAPVPLTYNGRTSFPTFCGGVATLITILVCLYWWIAIILTAEFFPSRNFTFSQKTRLTSKAGTASPTF